MSDGLQEKQKEEKGQVNGDKSKSSQRIPNDAYRREYDRIFRQTRDKGKSSEDAGRDE